MKASRPRGPVASLGLASSVRTVHDALYTDFLTAAPKEWARVHQVVIERVADALIALGPAAPTLDLNAVMGLGTSRPGTPEVVERILARVRESGASVYSVQIEPAARPRELPHWLEERGLRAGRGWSVMVRDVSPPPRVATELRVERIGAAQAEQFVAVALGAFAMPPVLAPLFAAPVGREGWLHYLAFDGSLPVACAVLFVHDDVGWLGIDGTLPSHRRRGAQGALQARRIRDGALQGCRLLVTESDEPLPEEENTSFNNMRRVGFEPAYVCANYVPA